MWPPPASPFSGHSAQYRGQSRPAAWVPWPRPAELTLAPQPAAQATAGAAVFWGTPRVRLLGNTLAHWGADRLLPPRLQIAPSPGTQPQPAPQNRGCADSGSRFPAPEASSCPGMCRRPPPCRAPKRAARSPGLASGMSLCSAQLWPHSCVSQASLGSLFPALVPAPAGEGRGRGPFLWQPPFLLFLIFFFMVSPTLKLSRQFTDCRKEKSFSCSGAPSRAAPNSNRVLGGPFPALGWAGGFSAMADTPRLQHSSWPSDILEELSCFPPEKSRKIFPGESLGHMAS